MKRLILILMGLGLAGLISAQRFAAAEPYAFILLEDDTVNILPTDNVYKVSVYVDESSTDSCEVAGKIYTLDEVATDTIAVAPGLNLSIGGAWSRKLDTTSIISRDGCKAIITIMK
jgi:hypothetical protein